MRWVIKQQDHNKEVLEYLRDIHSFSKRIITAIKFSGGQMVVNGKPITVRYRLQTGDVLAIQFPPEEVGQNLSPEDLPLHIIYEDDDIIVVNKPAGVAVMPSANHKTGSLANRLLAYYAKHHIPYTVHIVTRLDRDTSGLLLVAKHRYSHSLLAKAQQTGEIKRRYSALVTGYFKNKQGIINAPIARKAGSIIEREVNHLGRNAVTAYNVLKEMNGISFIEVTLKTGRTHQIRVHFSYMGHPLLGDDLYGGTKELIDRQALHCHYLSFKHPLTKKQVSYHLPLPNDMRLLI